MKKALFIIATCILFFGCKNSTEVTSTEKKDDLKVNDFAIIIHGGAKTFMSQKDLPIIPFSHFGIRTELYIRFLM